MTLPTDWVTDLLEGLAQHLVTAGVGVFHDGTYAASDIGISIGALAEPCDRAIAITDYGMPNDQPNQALSQVSIQVWTRGQPDSKTDANNLRGLVFASFQGLTHVQFGTAHLIQLLRKSSIPMGMDAKRRWEISDNYTADVNPPATPLRNQ